MSGAKKSRIRAVRGQTGPQWTGAGFPNGARQANNSCRRNRLQLVRLAFGPVVSPRANRLAFSLLKLRSRDNPFRSRENRCKFAAKLQPTGSIDARGAVKQDVQPTDSRRLEKATC